MNENLPIDPAMLDEEWLQQPLFFDQAQQEAADCLKARDELKDELADLEAKLSDDVRRNYKDHNFEKAPTVQGVSDFVQLHEDIQALKASLREANHSLNLANNTVRSFEMRKSALAKLTDLHISNYFSIPNPGRLVAEGKRYIDLKNEKVQAQSKEAVKQLNEKKEKRAKDGKTKEEVLDKITNPETKEAARVAIEAEEQSEQSEPRRRRRR